MATVDSPHTSAFRAASRALDHAIEAAIGGTPSHVSGTTFVPSDLAATGRVGAYRRVGPVSIIDSEGNETRLSQDYSREIVIALVIIVVVALLASRRPRVQS